MVGGIGGHCLSLLESCCNTVQDRLKLLTGFGLKLDAEVQELYRQQDLSGCVEAMKTRKAVQLMHKALRDFNPKLAKAFFDDRDEVTET